MFVLAEQGCVQSVYLVLFLFFCSFLVRQATSAATSDDVNVHFIILSINLKMLFTFLQPSDVLK